jgi:nucleoside 2-deoxyribosyltransferase
MFTATVLRIMIASPGDTAEQRRAIREAIDGWNAGQAERTSVVVLPLSWEMDAVPLWGNHPQAILNEQLADRADILIATFSARLGTATPTADSGTVEEIEHVAERGVPVLLYFDASPIDRMVLDLDQYGALQEFRQRARGESFYREYQSVEDLRYQVMVALSQLVVQVAPAEPIATSSQAPAIPIVAKQDIEVYQETDNKGRLKTRKRYYLKIENVSRELLFNITVRLRPSGDGDPERVPRLVDADEAIATLAPGIPMRFPVLVGGLGNPQYEVAVSWLDKEGEQHEAISTVRFM